MQISIRNKPFYRGWDFYLLASLLLLTNYPLFFGGNTTRWAFYPGLVKQGEWWRVFTGLLTHVSWYHLLLDGLPFFLVYLSLDEKRIFCRLFYIILAGAGSLLAGIWFSPLVPKVGLRGLSGITYGIAALGALEMVFRAKKDKTDSIIGAAVFSFLLLLVAYETLTGKFPFGFLLFGMVGTPILVCHAGGIAGSVIAYAVVKTINLNLNDRMRKK
ncbi:MAG: rhomboid family intramembrane serine protease [Candidatus Omnitrophota bacterium]|nr:rhomboid family intramembrane serine protease [Candidatus Omnitrophota bacterium]